MTGLATATGASVVPGDAEAVDWLGREYARYAAGACDAARALRLIDTGAWVGPAGDAFRRAIGEVPDKLERGQVAFARAAGALSDYAWVLREAQVEAAAAVRRYADGQAATAAWQSAQGTPGAAAEDPGQDDRRRAEHQVADARQRVEVAARRAAGVLEDARREAPHEPGLLSKAVHAVGSFLRGAGEATWGLAELAYKTSLVNAVLDPKGFADFEASLAKGVVYGVEHPKELGKAVIDYDTWRTDPARALGHLVPDLLLAAATAGVGEAGAAGGRVAEGAEALEALSKTVDVVEGAEVAEGLAATAATQRGAGAAAKAAGLSDEAAAALEERFGSPAEGALGFQGKDLYPGRDNWFDTLLDKGDTFSVGSPGEGQFAAAPESVAEVGTDARRYYEGLQVGPRVDPVDGVPRYRSSLLTFEVQKPLPVAESIAAANPQFGAGGLRQFYLPDRLAALVEEGYVSAPVRTEMTNLEAALPATGLDPAALAARAAPGMMAGDGLHAVGHLTESGACR